MNDLVPAPLRLRVRLINAGADTAPAAGVKVV